MRVAEAFIRVVPALLNGAQSQITLRPLLVGAFFVMETSTIQKSTVIGNSVASDGQGADILVKGSVKSNYDEESTLGDVFPPT